MSTRRFHRREPPRKVITCRCGAHAKLMKRRHFPFGRKSDGRTSRVYKCIVCRDEYALTKPQEVKRR